MEFIKKYRSIIFLLSIILITTNLWILSKSSLNEIIQDPILSSSQIAALLGTTFLSFELILISRAKFLEKILGPLDRIYKYHRLLSIFSVIALIMHSMTLIIGTFPKFAIAQIYILPNINNLTYAAGIIALYTFVITIFLSLYIKLPYHLWKLSHRILAMSVLFGTFHIFTINSDISNNLLLKSWIVGGLIIGVISMLYKVIFYPKLAKTYSYKVFRVIQDRDITRIEMLPVSERMKYKPGQFAYFSFYSNAVSNEEHPFSITSKPSDKMISIAVKSLGHYTENIRNINKGDRVKIKGAYGQFGDGHGKYKNEIWIGAGIGITPFISLEPYTQTQIYYCTRNQEEAVFYSDLEKKIKDSNTIINLKNHRSNEEGWFTPEKIQNDIQGNDTCVRLCGPKGLLDSFKNYFKENGLSLDNLKYEDFNFLD